MEESGLDSALTKRVVELISSKNRDDLKVLCLDNGITDTVFSKLAVLTDNFPTVDSAIEKIEGVCSSDVSKSALSELKCVCDLLKSRGYVNKINIDFSIAGNMGYYSGVVFNGYIKGIPTAVLSGGRYDRLMQKMGRKSGAIGFAVYLDALERLDLAEKAFDVDVVLISGNDIEATLNTSEMLSAGGSSCLVCSKLPQDIRAKKILKITEKGLETVYGND